MGLNDEINRRRAEISSDGYAMSVGELISMYENGELNIRPQFNDSSAGPRIRDLGLLSPCY